MVDAVRVEGLEKDYGATRALRGIDLEVREGEVFGFLGPNGAGKSTAIRILVDLIRPTGGHVSVLGRDCQADSVAARRLIGYLPSAPVFPSKMTAMEVFEYVARLRGGGRAQAAVDGRYRDELIARLGLAAGRQVSELSRGNQQKVGLVQALMFRGPVVILDEPTTGLDPLMQAEVESILRECVAEGRTVFFSSHLLEEVESVCDRAAIVRDGLIVDVFNLAEQRRLSPVRVEVEFGGRAPEGDAFAGLPSEVRVVSVEGGHGVFEVRDGFDALVKRLAQFQVDSMVARPATLEEIFIRHYRDEVAVDGDESGVSL